MGSGRGAAPQQLQDPSRSTAEPQLPAGNCAQRVPVLAQQPPSQGPGTEDTGDELGDKGHQIWERNTRTRGLGDTGSGNGAI